MSVGNREISQNVFHYSWKNLYLLSYIIVHKIIIIRILIEVFNMTNLKIIMNNLKGIVFLYLESYASFSYKYEINIFIIIYLLITFRKMK